jgi:hypothetical protein
MNDGMWVRTWSGDIRKLVWHGLEYLVIYLGGSYPVTSEWVQRHLSINLTDPPRNAALFKEKP